MNKSPAEVNQLITAISQGDSAAAEDLFPIVYEELHRLASAYMKRERVNHTLQPTALINEAFLKLTNASKDEGESSYENLNHFMATAALVMRRILVNHAKSKSALKRGGGNVVLELEDTAAAFNDSAIDLVALDEAMKKLAAIDETQHRLVELKFFGGMTAKQCADVLGISERAVYYEWAHARAWLRSQVEGA